MTESLTFTVVYDYDLRQPGITVDAVLRSGNQEVICQAKVDTGASYCIFERIHGEVLGLDIEAGHKQKFGTAVGSFYAYGHEITITVLGLEIEATAYFAEHDGFERNVLGQIGWLNRVRLGLVDEAGKLYLSRNEDEF